MGRAFRNNLFGATMYPVQCWVLQAGILCPGLGMGTKMGGMGEIGEGD